MVRRLLPLLSLLLAACSGADKVTGVGQGGVKTLTLANASLDQSGLQPWVDEVSALSHGRLRIRVLSNWRLGQRWFETGLIRDVRAGRVQLGWVGTRPWPAEGVHDFDALDVPFQVRSYAGEAAELRAATAARLLGGVRRAGVVPVALWPGVLHFLLTRRPLASGATLRGLRVGMFASPVGAAALRAAGAAPVPEPRGAGMQGLDAMAAQLGNLAAEDVAQARYLVADVPLGPVPRVLFANRRAWGTLTPAQRAILVHAAERVSPAMLRNLEAGDRDARAQLCDAGVRVVDVGAPGRAALQRSVEPAYARVRALPAARAGVEAVEQARPADTVPPAPACARSAPPQHVALSGVFAYTVHHGDPGTAGDDFEGFPWLRAQVVFRDGRAVQTVSFPDGHSEPGFDEPYSVYRDRITFGADSGAAPLTARWQLDGDRLRFTEMNGGPDDHRVWELRPWIRVRR